MAKEKIHMKLERFFERRLAGFNREQLQILMLGSCGVFLLFTLQMVFGVVIHLLQDTSPVWQDYVLMAAWGVSYIVAGSIVKEIAFRYHGKEREY